MKLGKRLFWKRYRDARAVIRALRIFEVESGRNIREFIAIRRGVFSLVSFYHLMGQLEVRGIIVSWYEEFEFRGMKLWRTMYKLRRGEA